MINLFSISTIIFFIISCIIFYIYFGYPLLLLILSKFFKITISRNFFEPFVTFIVAAYNEDQSIKDKIENCLDLKYPKGKLQIIIASDGSTDKTNEICETYKSKGIILVILLSFKMVYVNEDTFL